MSAPEYILFDNIYYEPCKGRRPEDMPDNVLVVVPRSNDNLSACAHNCSILTPCMPRLNATNPEEVYAKIRSSFADRGLSQFATIECGEIMQGVERLVDIASFIQKESLGVNEVYSHISLIFGASIIGYTLYQLDALLCNSEIDVSNVNIEGNDALFEKFLSGSVLENPYMTHLGHLCIEHMVWFGVIAGKYVRIMNRYCSRDDGETDHPESNESKIRRMAESSYSMYGNCRSAKKYNSCVESASHMIYHGLNVANAISDEDRCIPIELLLFERGDLYAARIANLMAELPRLAPAIEAFVRVNTQQAVDAAMRYEFYRGKSQTIISSVLMFHEEVSNMSILMRG